MKKFLFTTLIAFSSLISFADNSFEIIDLKQVLPFSNLEKSGINFYFELKVSTNNDYFYQPFTLTFNLYDRNNKKVYSDSENLLHLYMPPSYGIGTVIDTLEERFFIPFYKINVPEGQQNLTARVLVQTENTAFFEIYSQEIVIDKIKIFKFDEQNFEIENFIVDDNYSEKELFGININFDCKFLFCSYQIEKYDIKKENSTYVFYINLFEKSTGKQIYFFDKTSNYQSFEVSKLDEKIDFFIPYNKINIQEGKHQLIAKLHVTDSHHSFDFGEVSETEFEINQPELSIAKFVLENLKAEHKTYDTKSIIAQIFSKTDKGKGFPDIFWNIELGDIQIYKSDINKNSFVAKGDSLIFIISENDPIWFNIYDYDTFNSNDLIASFQIENIMGFKTVNYKNPNLLNIDTCNFSFTKSMLPFFEYNTLSINQISINGVSGLDIEFTSKINSIPDNEKIKFVPYIIRDSLEINFESINKILYPENLYFTQNESQQKFKTFIPYFMLRNFDRIGLKFNFKNFDFSLVDILYPENIMVPELNDLKCIISSIEETYVNDCFGVEIKTEIEIPKLYSFFINPKTYKFIESFNYQLISDTISFEKTSTQFQDTLLIRNFFIPYSNFNSNNTEYQISYNNQINYLNNYILSKNENNFIIKTENLVKIKFNNYKCKLTENEDYEKYYFKIIYQNNVIYKSENITTENHSESIDLDKQFHEKDIIKIEFYGISKFGLEEKIIEKKYKITKIMNEDLLKIKHIKEIKKFYLNFNILNK